jgi:hypothetical protein
MHWLDNPLDPDFVPYTVALTAALSGKHCLMEEFGGCTAPPGEDSQMWDWVSFGKPRKQFMASEEALAEYLRLCLPKLTEAGSPGAMVWCFADYAPELWDRPPCDEAIHERHFGLVRPDGSLKPHALTIKEFAASKPVIQSIPEWARLDVSADDYYSAPADNLKLLWDVYHQRMASANA